MTFINYFPTAGNDGNFGALSEISQTAANRSDGWTVAKIAAGTSAEFDAGTMQASGTFTSETTTPKPASFLTGTTANAFKTATAITGNFANGAWTFKFVVRTAVASTQRGRPHLRVFKSVNADGSAATELTASTQIFPAIVSISTTVDNFTSFNWSPGTDFTLTNEYLFFVWAWEITTAGGSNTADIVIRTGTSTATGTYFSPADFTAGSAAAPIPDVGMALTVT